MGALGLRVVTGENERAVQSWLLQHLERVEDTLMQEARGDELPYRVLERMDIDTLAARVGLDLNVYRGFELASTSRPQLARDRLIGMRLPVEAYKALFVDGYRFADVDERLGTFEYTAGYRSFPDEQGVPRYVVSVPTLPEQDRLEEERARTVAYLFGALLLLVLVVMGTAAVIANALALPVARIRRGLERVAEGRFDRIQPLETRDEMSELVGTFNTMQDQLAESRRLLAQQERQLAWREMARQVAHEIKNPLTPMKLSVQIMQKAFTDPKEGRPFDEVFREKTAALIDQINALARIANEFSSYARMPLQSLEPVDLNAVVREAAELMSANASIRFEMDLHDGPLTVEADREALRRVFINFVKNAVESVPVDKEGRIRITTDLEDDIETGLPWVVAEVSDNGCGIAPELREKIFTPSFSTKTSGAGLGLAIARNTVEELRGRIGFDTEEGRGSTFWVRIPLFQASEDADGPV
jgi:nitrogen fixation/metabolism regulation signal transduction histidine kinase